MAEARAENQGAETPLSGGSQREWQAAMLYHNEQRTLLSNERTLLAWVRTSLALITLGFVVQRFDLLLGGAGASASNAPTLAGSVPVLFFVLGGIIVALGAYEFYGVRRDLILRRTADRRPLRDALVLTTLTFVVVVSGLFVVFRP